MDEVVKVESVHAIAMVVDHLSDEIVKMP